MCELCSPGNLGPRAPLQGPHCADPSFPNSPLKGADVLQITKLSKVIRASRVPRAAWDGGGSDSGPCVQRSSPSVLLPPRTPIRFLLSEALC